MLNLACRIPGDGRDMPQRGAALSPDTLKECR
jgi:hypothetical protein